MKTPWKTFFLLTAAGFAEALIFRRLAIFDDAYITYRYARNIARGLGPVFNPGERVEGCTTFLQMVFLSPFAAWKIDLRIVSVAVSFLCLAFIGAAGRAKIVEMQGERRGASVWHWFFPAMIVTSPALVTWAISGMETIWLTAAVFAAVWATGGEVAGKRLPFASALLSVVASLIRPEGMILAAMLGLSWLLFEKEKRLRKALAFGVAFAVLYGAYFLWRYSYYGFLFPNTYYAKVGRPSPVLILRGVRYLLDSLLAGIVPPVVIWLLFLAHRRRLPLDRGEKTILLVIAGQAFQTVWTGGDFFMFFRFMIPVWPLVLFLAFSLGEKIFTNLPAPDPTGKKAKRFFWRLNMTRPRAIAFLFVLNLCLGLYGFNGVKTLIQAGFARQWERESRLLKPLIPLDATVTTVAIGAMGYILDLPLIDMAGLTDAAIAHSPIQTGLQFPGHEKYNTEYILSREPDFALFCIKEAQTPMAECSLDPDGLAVMPPLRDILKNPAFHSRYVYANHESGSATIATFVRRDKIGRPGYEGWLVADDRRTD